MYKLCKTEQSANRQRQLEEGLLQIMLTRHFEEVSVSELCDQLQIPRKSFYRYFSSKDGTTLVKETRTVHYSTNISLEKLVMEQLIEGPKKGATATIPSETKIITLSVMDGICYVNLDNNFQNQKQYYCNYHLNILSW